MIPDSLSVHRLSVAYDKKTILNNIDIPGIAAGNVTVFAGPNGAGKSTLLRAITGIIPATGQALFGKTDLLKLSPRALSRIVGFMPQTGTYGARLTVIDTIIASLQLFGTGMSRTERYRRTAETLERLGISDLAFCPVNQLSGGQRQLATLAQSLARKPKVLILDEPTSALDLKHQFEVMNILRGIAREGCVVVLVLHDLTLAAQWADQMVFLNKGRLVAHGSPVATLNTEILTQVYGVHAHVKSTPQSGTQILVHGVVE